MKAFNLLAIVGASPHFASAAVHLSYSKQQRSNGPSTGSSRRSINSNISYNEATYVVNVTVGTPGQAMTLELSTSSSDTWVMDSRSSECAYSDYDYSDTYNTNITFCKSGTFSPADSSSCVVRETSSSDDDDDYYGDENEFTSSYNGGATAYGDYMNDVLTIDGMAISNFTMGLVNETSHYLATTSYMGVLGIGYNDSSSDNLPDLLLKQGLINTTAYSIWVDDATAASGNLLFGAIDTTKFIGNLTRLTSSYSYVDMIVQVVGINGTTKSGGAVPITVVSSADDDSSSGEDDSDTDGGSYVFPAVFSPPDTLSIFPADVASQIWEMAGAYYQAYIDMALIGCSAASDTTTYFTFQLGGQGPDGPIITAYMSDLVIPRSEYNMSTNAYYYSDVDDDLCLFGIQNSSSIGYSSIYSNQYNLGSTLLRRTYSVFDLANSEVAIAPVVFGASAISNVVPFDSYGATVPSSTIVCYYSDCYADAGNNDGTDDTDSSEAGSIRLPGVLSLGAIIGLSVGLALGWFALGLAGFFFWRHRRNKGLATEKEASVSSAEAGQPGPEMTTAVAGIRSAPGMAQAAPAPILADPAPSEGIDKGKRPEVAPSLPPRPIEEQPGTSSAEGSTAHGPQH